MPAKPETKSYEDLVRVLTEHFQLKLPETVQHFTFHVRTHQPRESVAAYVAELCSITEHCNFDASLQMMLRDQLVCDINDKVVQRHLLSESPLPFEKALSLVLAWEVTVTISYKQQQANVLLVMEKGDGPSLFGRNCLEQFCLDWQEIYFLQPYSLESLMERHQAMFQEGLETLRGHRVKTVTDPNPHLASARHIRSHTR